MNVIKINFREEESENPGVLDQVDQFLRPIKARNQFTLLSLCSVKTRCRRRVNIHFQWFKFLIYTYYISCYVAKLLYDVMFPTVH